MTVIAVEKDVDALTMTFVAEFDAPVERIWQVWADPRQLERWWGPPEWPASFSRHELVVGGEMRYAMTGPDGSTAPGWWRMTAVEPPHRLAFDDGFAGDDGEPDASMPVILIEVDLAPLSDGRTRMTTRTRYATADQFEQVVSMGMEEGMRSAMGQIDGILAAD